MKNQINSTPARRSQGININIENISSFFHVDFVNFCVHLAEGDIPTPPRPNCQIPRTAMPKYKINNVYPAIFITSCRPSSRPGPPRRFIRLRLRHFPKFPEDFIADERRILAYMSRENGTERTMNPGSREFSG